MAPTASRYLDVKCSNVPSAFTQIGLKEFLQIRQRILDDARDDLRKCIKNSNRVRGRIGGCGSTQSAGKRSVDHLNLPVHVRQCFEVNIHVLTLLVVEVLGKCVHGEHAINRLIATGKRQMKADHRLKNRQ